MGSSPQYNRDYEARDTFNIVVLEMAGREARGGSATSTYAAPVQRGIQAFGAMEAVAEDGLLQLSNGRLCLQRDLTEAHRPRLTAQGL